MRFVSAYLCPIVPPDSQIVDAVVVLLSDTLVIPTGTIHESEVIVSAPKNVAQLTV